MVKLIAKLKIVGLGVILTLLANTVGPSPCAEAQLASPAGGDFVLPQPGQMVNLSPAFNPPILRGIKVHPDNPFRFDFILDGGNRHPGSDGQEELRSESIKLIKYFLASLTIPDKNLWVNLSPYEKDRIVPEGFGETEMGRDLLAEDYMLKQISASLIYPEGATGKLFWQKIYAEAADRFGTTNIPMNTFNKVWIVPEKAVVYENEKAGTAYVVESKLKVMLEQDYLALRMEAPQGNSHVPNDNTNELGSQVMRKIVIPQLTKEVNEGKNFSQLRQVYNSLILATWYKRKIKDSILDQVYADQNKVAGVNIKDPQEKEKIYKRYLQAFKKGVFNYIKETPVPDGQIVPKKYFSGGALLIHVPLQATTDEAMVAASHGTQYEAAVRIDADDESLAERASSGLSPLGQYLKSEGNNASDILKAERLLHDHTRPVMLEIGTGDTRAALEFAHKGFNVIGIDIYNTRSGYESAIEFDRRQLKAQRENPSHLVILRASSSEIFEYLPKASLDSIVMIHPDEFAANGLIALLDQEIIGPTIRAGGMIIVKPYFQGSFERSAERLEGDAHFIRLPAGQTDIYGVSEGDYTLYRAKTPVYLWQIDSAMTHAGIDPRMPLVELIKGQINARIGRELKDDQIKALLDQGPGINSGSVDDYFQSKGITLRPAWLPIIVQVVQDALQHQTQASQPSAGSLLLEFKRIMIERSATFVGIDEIKPVFVAQHRLNDLEWDLYGMGPNKYFEIFRRDNQIAAYGIVTLMGDNAVLRFQSFEKNAGRGDYWASIFRSRVTQLQAALSRRNQYFRNVAIPTDQILSEDQLAKRARSYLNGAQGWIERVHQLINAVRHGVPLTGVYKDMINFNSFKEYYSFGPAANFYVKKLGFTLVAVSTATHKAVLSGHENDSFNRLKRGMPLSDLDIVELFSGRALIQDMAMLNDRFNDDALSDEALNALETDGTMSAKNRAASPVVADLAMSSDERILKAVESAVRRALGVKNSVAGESVPPSESGVAGLSSQEAAILLSRGFQARAYRRFPEGPSSIDQRFSLSSFSRDSNHQEKVLKIINEALGFDRNKLILSIGEGQGHLGAAMIALGYTHFVGIDINETFVEAAKKKFGAKAVMFQGDAYQLPFEDQKFDMVIFNESIGTMRLDAVLNQASRVLKPGGILMIISDYTRPIKYQIAEMRDTGYLRYSIEELGLSMHREGFKKINSRIFSREVSFLSYSPIFRWHFVIEANKPDAAMSLLPRTKGQEDRAMFNPKRRAFVDHVLMVLTPFTGSLYFSYLWFSSISLGQPYQTEQFFALFFAFLAGAMGLYWYDDFDISNLISINDLDKLVGRDFLTSKTVCRLTHFTTEKNVINFEFESWWDGKQYSLTLRRVHNKKFVSWPLLIVLLAPDRDAQRSPAEATLQGTMAKVLTFPGHIHQGASKRIKGPQLQEVKPKVIVLQRELKKPSINVPPDGYDNGIYDQIKNEFFGLLVNFISLTEISSKYRIKHFSLPLDLVSLIYNGREELKNWTPRKMNELRHDFVYYALDLFLKLVRSKMYERADKRAQRYDDAKKIAGYLSEYPDVLAQFPEERRKAYEYYRQLLSTDSAMRSGLKIVMENSIGREIPPYLMGLDSAHPLADPGGIDLTAMDNMIKAPSAGQTIKFYLDPAQLAQLQNAPGFVPVIIDFYPLPAGQAGQKSLQTFLGITPQA